MRWYFNLLPMLLLAGSLAAQNPCSITDLTAQVVDCANGEFFVTLNFQHENTSQQGFSVANNSGPIGQFAYADLPVTVGPFVAGTGVFYGFVVTDLADPACFAAIGLGPVTLDCTTLPCDQLTGLSVETGDCNANGTFELTLGLDISPLPSNFFFEVITSSGVSLGTYPLSELPLTIPDYPNSGGDVDSVTLCLTDLSNCCLTKKFNVPACPSPGCDIFDVQVSTNDCNPDGTYPIKVDFNYTTTSAASTFTAYSANGQNLGTYSLDSLPVQIPNFPGGTPVGVLKVCLDNQQSCCEVKEFQAPNCPPPPPSDCEIFKVRIQRDTCTSDTTYTIKLNFQVSNPDADSFKVWANAGQLLGTFPLDSLPLTIVNFPYDGGTTDKITICVGNSCCVTRKIRVPDCLPIVNCEIFDLSLQPGDCTSDSTYNLKVDFNALGADTDSVTIVVDGNNMGTFHADSTPIMLTNVLWGGGNTAQFSICYVGSNCCKTKNFAVPDCLPGVACEIYDLRVQVGDCNDDGTAYSIKINFEVANPDANKFHVWGNGGDVDFGEFTLDELPLTISDFPYGGGSVDNITICFSNDCCVTRSFKVPNCVNGNDCLIHDVRVRTGQCNPDGTYRLRVNFQVQNAVSDSFNITAPGGQVFGPYSLTDLPVFIKFFPGDGGFFDELKICMLDSAGTGCCKVRKFAAPNCSGACDIANLAADPGACNPDGSYSLTLNFATTLNDSTAQFEVIGNGENLGTYSVADLPITIANFPNGNSNEGVVKVCIIGQPNCCATTEFQEPDCPTLCDIADLVADPGACNPDGSYNLVLNFSVQTPGISALFHVFGNGQDLGTYGLDDLPLTIPNFPNNNEPVGVLKVCLDNVPNCCAIVEFQQPNCNNNGPCEITDLAVDTAGCFPDGTFTIFVAFGVNGSVDSVDIYGNDGSVYFGRFPASASPVQIVNFPSSPGSMPTVKVCAADNPDCCASTEFQAPDCPSPDPCSITNVQALATPCISGQFFAIVTFDFTSGSAQGYSISGNGETYGSYFYDGVQPIIIGPLQGDGTTEYYFVVQDNEDQNCGGVDTLGVIDCQQIDPRTGSLYNLSSSLSMVPNPVSDWLTVSAVLPNQTDLNPGAQVQIFGADGRMVRSVTVGDARAFQMDVSALQPGLYRLCVQTPTGRVNGTFAKQ